MWWESKGEEVVKDTIATSSSVREGVDRLLDYFQKRHPNAVWQKMANLDYEADVKDIQEWFAAQLPFPDSVEVLWLAFWDETVGFDLRGATRWSQDPENWDWWFHDDFHGKSYESPILAGMHTLARKVENPEYPTPKGGVWDLTEFLFTIGYVGLVAAQVFRSIDQQKLLGGRAERWVVTGFPDAVYGIIVGRITAGGFVPFEKPPSPSPR
jgi:hypothetical protein